MKKLLFITILFFTLQVKSQDFKPVVKTDHIAIVVSDLNVSAQFYAEILGLNEITNQTKKPNIRWFAFADGVELHLINVERAITHVKDVHIAVAVNDLDAFMKMLLEKDIYYENWQGEAKTSNSRPDGVNQVYLQDPDGYWIEVNDANRF